MITYSATLDVPRRWHLDRHMLPVPARGHRRARRPGAGDKHVILDGTLIFSDQVAETIIGTKGTPIHLRYSGKHRRFGANIQFVATADGFPLWVSESPPGSTPDLVAAREHQVTGALYATATQGLVTLADKGYQGTGIGIHTPTKVPADGNTLDADTVCRNTLLSGLRCVGERAAALLTTRWKVLDRITLCPEESDPSPKQHSC